MKYELRIVDDNEQEEVYIGQFKNECELEQWAKENRGVLKTTESEN
jgi:hypothetical protein